MHDVSARAVIERMEAVLGGHASNARVIEASAPAR
jgi:hypothetical protein